MTITAAQLAVIMPALATPFTPDGAVALDTLEALVARYLDKGVEGLFVCGTGGESLLLSLEERERILETVVAVNAGAVPVVAHIGAVNTADSVRLARHAEAAGADAISAIPPVYFSYSKAAIVGHYQTIMDATALPMVLYNIPSLTGIEFTVDWPELLGDPRVIGMKHTSGNISSLQLMKAAYPDKTFLGGFDDLFVPAMSVGATGAIGVTAGSCFELYRAARDHFQAGRVDDARRVQGYLAQVLQALFANDLYPAAKYLAERDIKPLTLGGCRPPFRPLSPEGKANMDVLLAKLDTWITTGL
ncbi:MAG: dihydrodipicolinate synthase family protein [Bifidobacteriaceae bacterium]|jgi:N-acetylneuraminate lyase|nr:dihydrodipicolinate synthase family protein [Bifidobacteriaceae bacterium]